ncbi:MAG: penicillin-binding protein 1A, partial [Nitrospirales bacterium]
YTPNLSVGVWVGFDDRRTLGDAESGARAALPIWIDFMKLALRELSVLPFEIPDGIEFVRVDPNTGLRATDNQGVVEIFEKGTEPKEDAPQRVDPTDFYQLDQLPDNFKDGL